MDANLAMLLTTVLVAIVGVLVPLSTLFVKYRQDSRIENARIERAVVAAHEVKAVAIKVERALATNTARVDTKLDEIHLLVNGNLEAAIAEVKRGTETINELKAMLLKLAPNDPRVQAVVTKTEA